MNMSPQMLRSMGDELTKISSARKEAAMESGTDRLRRAIQGGVGAGTGAKAERLTQELKDIPGAQTPASALKRVVGKLRGKAKGVARSGGYEAGEGFKDSLEDSAAKAVGALKQKLKNPKTLAAVGAGGVALGGLAAYGAHHKRKRQQQDMTQAIQQGMYGPQ